MYIVTAQNGQQLFNQSYNDYQEASETAHDLVEYTKTMGGTAFVGVTRSSDGALIWSYEINPDVKN